jgi:subtilisin family serine protease
VVFWGKRRAAKTKKTILYSTVLLAASAALARADIDSAAPAYVPNQIVVKFQRPLAHAIQQHTGQLSLSANLDRLNAEYRLRHIKPIFKNFRQRQHQLKTLRSKNPALLTSKQKRLITRLARAPAGARVPQLDRIYKITLDLEPGQSIHDVLQAYRNDPDVEYAELNYIVSTCAEPNDPFFGFQWALNNTGQIYPESGTYNDPPGTPDSDIDAPAAWNLIAEADDIIVAVLDTGVDYTHDDMNDNMWINEAELNGIEGVDDDNNLFVDDIYGYDFINLDGDPKDDNGHGTHVCGILAAEGDNGRDIAGVCWKTQIMALKFLGSDGRGDSTDAIDAVYYAVENGADIISNSWGGIPLPGSFPRHLEDAFDYAHSQGVISIAAAGNNGATFINFPAIFDNVIAVAATNSNDKRPSFSNHGPLVEIAAPGVDILSLRADGTALGSVYDPNTTINSGTSMACPHVSGAFALVLSFYPHVDIELARDFVFENTDPIAPSVSVWGRLNLHKALWAIAGFHKAIVQFDRNLYSCSDTIAVTLSDLSLVGDGFADVNVTTDDGDAETVTLTEEGEFTGVFSGTIVTAAGAPVPADNAVQLSHGQTITVTYNDENDGTGNPAIAADTAKADCVPPLIFNVQIDVPGPEPSVTFETNEPTTAMVFAGTTCGGPYVLEPADPQPAKTHTISLGGVLPETDYFFVVQANDVAGNKTIDDNNALCYAFTTTGPADIFVPADYPNIQEAIFRSWDAGTVWLDDGIYSGDGNRDVDFMARAITVRSRNGPQNCIIDCQATQAEHHYGFLFDKDEGPESILQGVTITNGFVAGFAFGGAITCVRTSPTIIDCILVANTARRGGAIACKTASPTIASCTLTSNTAESGAAISVEDDSPLVINCVVAGNHAERGAGFWARTASPQIINSTFVANRATDAVGGIFCWRGNETVSNCIIWANSGPLAPQFRGSNDPAYCCIQDWTGGGPGNIDIDPCFVDPGFWDTNGTPNEPNDDYWIHGDYHLKSAGWRWDRHATLWTWDLVTSRCIDAGNPGSLLADEPITLYVDPLNRIGQNLRINMGAHGRTEMAAMPPYDWTLLADLNNDGTVDLLDLELWTLYYLTSGNELPGDLDRNGAVDIRDFTLLIRGWSLQTTWYMHH